ncbi:MAG TPA: GspE/PulE family protein [Patescibacteria group bacterium]
MDKNKALYDLLKQLQIINNAKLDEMLQIAQSQNLALGTLLVDKSLITEENIGVLEAQVFGVPFIRLSTIPVPQGILMIIPEIIAKKERMIAFKKDQHGLFVAMENPDNLAIRNFLQTKLGLPLIPYFATRRDIDKALTLYWKDLGKAFDDIMLEYLKNVKNGVTDIPIIKIVDTIIAYAHKNNASDIHMEPDDTAAIVRFRIDGILHDVVRIPIDVYPEIIRRVKVMAHLRTDDTQNPQDGKIQVEVDSDKLELRVSTAPLRGGTSAVLRLLSERSRQISLISLGLDKNDLAKVEVAYKKPYGTILATGPTGSGKTTTMYAIVKLLNNRDVKIMTIEDPIEYEIDGVNQMQVNLKTNLTFAAGLRSILRQDPNIILVGEVRDTETAAIATNAAMTGHLVLSTLHTNDAGTAIPRLFEMGVEPFLIASTINLIIAQRLVRKICTRCRTSQEIAKSELLKSLNEITISKFFDGGNIIRLYKGKGCEICHNTGFEGRTGIFEVLVVDEELRKAIIGKKDAETIRSIGQKNGMQTMFEDGLKKVVIGETTLDEVIRVTQN